MRVTRELKQALSGLWSLVVGLGITGRYFFDKQVTVHYPRKVVETENILTYRGHIELVGKPKEPDVPKCISCMMCATICPSGCITVKKTVPPKPKPSETPYRDPNPVMGEEMVPVPRKTVAPPEKQKPIKTPSKFGLDYTLCSLCGLCVQNCPVKALRFSTDIYLAGPSRATYKYDLIARLKRQAEAAAAAKPPRPAKAEAAPVAGDKPAASAAPEGAGAAAKGE